MSRGARASGSTRPGHGAWTRPGSRGRRGVPSSGRRRATTPRLCRSFPHGSSLSLAYDTDGSVLVAVADVAGSEDSVLVFDCELHAQACEPIGRIKISTQDPLFLDGARP